MFKRQLVHQSPRRAPKNRRVATRLQPTTPAQLVGLLAARRVCTHTSGDPRMRRASTWRLEKETQTSLLRNQPDGSWTKRFSEVRQQFFVFAGVNVDQ